MDLLKHSNKYSETSVVFNGNFQTLLELGFFRSTVCQVQRFQENGGKSGSSRKLGQNELQVTTEFTSQMLF